MIEIKNISFAYGNRPILRDISFQVQPGEVVGILGNNGVGKSTLITCLNHIRVPQRGGVFIDGRNVLTMGRRAMAKSIAYVAQNSELSQMTVFDSVLLGRKPHMKWSVTKEDMNLCEEILAQMGMSDYKLRYINELSGGEAQKVMLARALVQQPKLLLLDEPTGNLDPKNQHEVLALIQQIAKERQIGVLIVIHDLSLALKYCDQFLFMKEGTVYQFGDAHTITEDTVYDVYGIHSKIVDFHDRKMVLIG